MIRPPVPAAPVAPTFDVWTKVRDADGWSQIASAVTFDQATVYRDTCRHQLHIEQHKATPS